MILVHDSNLVNFEPGQQNILIQQLIVLPSISFRHFSPCLTFVVLVWNLFSGLKIDEILYHLKEYATVTLEVVFKHFSTLKLLWDNAIKM